MITELNIINTMLAAKGVAPVSSPNSQHPMVHAAKDVLTMVNQEVQERGWWFNTERDFPLSPDIQGHIIIPGDCLSVDPEDPNDSLVRRNGKMYDPRNHTFEISRVVPVKMVVLLDVSDLPPAFAQYVMHESAARYYLDGDADLQKARGLQQRAEQAWQRLNQKSISSLDVSARTSPKALLIAAGVRGAGGRYRPDRPGGR